LRRLCDRLVDRRGAALGQLVVSDHAAGMELNELGELILERRRCFA